ncbi:hypothetical protein FHS18_000952 [Paenibacillus phyllosphaerae]|uniref:Uncharacterized protein n=1 Tax=Paenibacillus phyllosphaerae TaxID=274593 RepID=A0A7W5AUA2_9BACL|nr:hypothetical protein [Paenibacillus phyllosphaerae]MBB3108900.1 hypothetical protein [Paenibacillus phyllosphaerae]
MSNKGMNDSPAGIRQGLLALGKEMVFNFRVKAERLSIFSTPTVQFSQCGGKSKLPTMMITLAREGEPYTSREDSRWHRFSTNKEADIDVRFNEARKADRRAAA